MPTQPSHSKSCRRESSTSAVRLPRVKRNRTTRSCERAGEERAFQKVSEITLKWNVCSICQELLHGRCIFSEIQEKFHSIESIPPEVAHLYYQSDYLMFTSQNTQFYILPYSQKTEGTAENDRAAVFCLRNPPKKPPATPHRRGTSLLRRSHCTPDPLKSLTVYQTATKKTGNKLHHMHHPWTGPDCGGAGEPRRERAFGTAWRRHMIQDRLSGANCTYQPVQNTQRHQACPDTYTFHLVLSLLLIPSLFHPCP